MKTLRDLYLILENVCLNFNFYSRIFCYLKVSNLAKQLHNKFFIMNKGLKKYRWTTIQCSIIMIHNL